MDGLVYLLALLGFLLVAKWLAGNRYENDCRRDCERRQAARYFERRMISNVSEKADNLDRAADEKVRELHCERRAVL